jgi:LPXTG-motif cell wall-anchored protein
VPAPPPPPAIAAAPGPPGGDAVYLKGGGMIRGTLLEMLPNDHATIQLSNGQNAIVPWNRIEHIERQLPQGQAPMVGVGPGVVSAPPETGSVVVHMDADDGVVLERIQPGSGRWILACTAPCDAALPLADEYRIGGRSIRRSRPFVLAGSPGQHIQISVSPASKGAFTGGIALSSVGAAALGIGLIVLLVGAIGTCTDEDEFGVCDASTPNTGLETTGAVITLAGVGLMVGGIVLLASNARTRETQTTAFAPPARLDTAWLRAPMWHDATRESAGQAKTMGFPVFTRSF